MGALRFEPSESLLLLDLDGTLIDSAPDMIEAFQDLLRQHDRPEADEGQLRAEMTCGTVQLLPTHFGVHPGEAGFQELREEYLGLYQDQGHARTELVDGMDELLAECGRLGLPWGIATNKLRYLAEEVVEALDLRPGVLVCADDVERAKPAPDMLLDALQQVQAPAARCLYAGDHGVDQQAADEAGVAFAAVGWGYAMQSMDLEACALVAETPRQLLDWFGGGPLQN